MTVFEEFKTASEMIAEVQGPLSVLAIIGLMTVMSILTLVSMSAKEGRKIQAFLDAQDKEQTEDDSWWGE
jgi:hypothetical protein